MKANKLKEILQQRVLVLDGATGTMVQQAGLEENDFRGERLAGHPFSMKGCNDILVLTRPDVVRGIHDRYLQGGADIITTDTFNANAISLADYGLGGDAALIRGINREAARLAREAAEEAGPRAWGGNALVAGSMGPTNRTASMSPEVGDPAARNVTYDDLYAAYLDQAAGLLEGGADVLLFETVFDTLNLKAGLDAANAAMRAAGRDCAILVSATISDKAGRTLSGQTVKAFADTVCDCDNVAVLGLNCSFGPADIIVPLRELAQATSLPVSCHPNAGLPNELGEYDETPETFGRHMQAILGERLVNIAGGCCGTTPEHIARLRELADKAQPRTAPVREPALRVTGLEDLEITPRNNFVNIGERCNVAGSRKFLRLIKEQKYDEALGIAAKQVADGAMIMDVNMDDAMIDSTREMTLFLRWLQSDPQTARVPVMVDSSNWETVEAGLKNLQGKAIVNSISLKEGEEKFVEKARRLKSLRAAVVVMAFDEKGQADTYGRKVEVSRRAYDILTKQCGFAPDDIILDVNIMAVATGIEQHNRYAIDFIEAVRWIKNNLPGARTSGGVSNLSFAFRGKNALREAMHAVFLHHAIEAGLDMAILNPATSVTYDSIEPELRTLLEDVILARRPEAADLLANYAMTEGQAPKETTAPVRDLSVPLDDRLANAIIGGKGEWLADDLNEALDKGMVPVEIISGPLMKGMKEVGERFGAGRMFLPQVVRTARIMKEAVDILKPHMARGNDNAPSTGKVLFATVKGDVHDIGKNIAAIVMACNNYEVTDLGVMVTPAEIVEAARREQPDLICLSGLITPSLAEMANTVRALADAGIDTPVMVGGATTSALHTALRIATLTQAPVIHVADAAQNPVIAARLLDAAGREGFIKELRDSQRQLRETYIAKHGKLRTIEEARNARHREDWDALTPHQPEVKPGQAIVMDIRLADITPLIDWRMLLHAWKMEGDPADLGRLAAQGDAKAAESLRLLNDAGEMLADMNSDGSYNGKGAFGLYNAHAEGDDIVAGGVRIPVLRQQRSEGESLSLADYVAPEGRGDMIGVFAVTAGTALEERMAQLEAEGDTYRAMLLQTLADRLAEASAEWLHRHVEKDVWKRPVPIRPAFGYPSLPDQTALHRAAGLLPLGDLGITVTENGAMSPKASVCGLYISAPGARYFMVGDTGDDQRADYARRCGVAPERVNEILRR